MEADTEDLAQILVQHYVSDYAVKVTTKILKKIHHRCTTEMLLEEILKGEPEPQIFCNSCYCLIKLPLT